MLISYLWCHLCCGPEEAAGKVMKTLHDWGIQERVKIMSYDVTAPNTGHLADALDLIKLWFKRDKISNVRLQVLMEVSIKTAVFWFVVPRCLVEVDQCFRDACCLVITLPIEAASICIVSNFYQTTQYNN
jgi:hypothetical protein